MLAAFRRLLILSHRYLGIVLSLLIMMWFATGIVMMYAGGMPRLSPQMRLERLAGVDMSRVRLTPAEAAGKAGIGERPGRATLLTVLDRPAYRFGTREPVTVFADSGDLLDELSTAQSRTVAARFMAIPEDRIEFVRTLDGVDQWTLGQSRQLPLHKLHALDADDTELYVQPATGEVVVMTTRGSRALAWIGTIPHWLYFAGLRANQPLWYRIVVWTSGFACVVAVLGLLLGLTQFRRTRPFRLSAIPYSGWMRWHYVTGVVFGVFTLTWAFSGLLSMEPFAWTNATGLEVSRDVFTGGPVDLDRFSTKDPAAWRAALAGRAIKEMEFVRIQGDHYYLVHPASDPLEAGGRERLHQPYNVSGRLEGERLLLAADTLEARREPFSEASLVNRLKAAVPDVPILDATLLSDYDSYYYSRGRQTPLPVLRVKFDDPAKTWFYIDPETSQMLAQVHRLNRVERWLYNGLHSLDFSFWYNRRPLWDVVMIALCLGGLATSTLGFAMGVKRLRRGAASVLKPGRVIIESAARPAPARGAATDMTVTQE